MPNPYTSGPDRPRYTRLSLGPNVLLQHYACSDGYEYFAAMVEAASPEALESVRDLATTGRWVLQMDRMYRPTRLLIYRRLATNPEADLTDPPQ